MGYTHYWRFTAPAHGEKQKVEKAYQAAIKECAKIVRTYYAVNGGLSGYTAHTPIGQYGGLKVNGKGNLMHEDFTMRDTFIENLEPDNWHFCKTARKPYDIVVVACLIVLSHRLPKHFRADSDGTKGDWVDGLKLAQKVLRKNKLSIPEHLRDSVLIAINGGK